MNGVCISIRTATSSLEILPTNQATVYVDVRHRYRAYFLKVEVKECSIDLEVM